MSVRIQCSWSGGRLLPIIRILAVCFSLSSNAFALECESRTLTLFYGNGIFNTFSVAKDSAKALGILAKMPVKNAFNVSDSVFEQLLRVVRQKYEDSARLFWTELAGLQFDDSEDPEVNARARTLRHKMIDLAKQYDSDRYVRDPILRDHVDRYRREIASGHHVTVVAHSQGNFYANSAGELLGAENQDKFAVLAVASPAFYVYGNGPYITNYRDRIIAAVRASRGALSANQSEKQTVLGHSFTDDYLPGPLFESVLRSVLWNDKSDDHFEPSKVDPNLRRFWRYGLNILTDPHRKLNLAECLALLSFGKMYKVQSSACGSRGLDSVLGVIENCRKEAWKTDHVQVGFWDPECGLTEIDEWDMNTGPFSHAIEAEHQECGGMIRQGPLGALEPYVDSAINLLKHPPPRATPAH